ncbi:hypothetical protein [Limnohabitans sp. Rim8]|jgi:hypothetical protein|uniref:hypothetical protein n=1 Tax=Limnohabitans sp. Rim8 TaxID=1100718 RepID=UPI002600E3C5|nr:hypothetical protein [Limnohabitans sp. Rim8]
MMKTLKWQFFMNFRKPDFDLQRMLLADARVTSPIKISEGANKINNLRFVGIYEKSSE